LFEVLVQLADHRADVDDEPQDPLSRSAEQREGVVLIRHHHDVVAAGDETNLAKLPALTEALKLSGDPPNCLG
jgi:riboflavin biosynthesis pyrimidine reductase